MPRCIHGCTWTWLYGEVSSEARKRQEERREMKKCKRKKTYFLALVHTPFVSSYSLLLCHVVLPFFTFLFFFFCNSLSSIPFPFP